MDAPRSRAVEALYQVLARTSPIRVAHHLREKLANQWLPAAQLEALQWRRLQAMLRHCALHVPFYRALWERNSVDPTRFTSAAQLGELPIVTREMLTDALLEGAFAGGPHQFLATSGTTRDRRFRVAIRFADYQRKYANHLRQLYAAGWRLGMRSAVLHNSGHGHFRGRYSGEHAHREPWHRLRGVAFAVAHRRLTPVPYHPDCTGDETIVAGWYRELTRHAPAVLDAFYMNALMLQDHIERHHLAPLAIPITFVLHSLSDTARRRLERALGGPVLNRYSPHECEGIAVACAAQRGMHVAIDSYVVEILDDAGRELRDGGSGRIVVTDLENHAMPLIRYDIGDLGRRLDEPCRCGRGFPLMADLEGRRQDALRGAAGGWVTPAQIERVFQGDSDVRFFQVRAEGARLRVDIVPHGPALPPSAADRYAARLRELLGPAPAIDIRTVYRVCFERNGKYAFVRNLADRRQGS